MHFAFRISHFYSFFCICICICICKLLQVLNLDVSEHEIAMSRFCCCVWLCVLINRVVISLWLLMFVQVQWELELRVSASVVTISYWDGSIMARCSRDVGLCGTYVHASLLVWMLVPLVSCHKDANVVHWRPCCVCCLVLCSGGGSLCVWSSSMQVECALTVNIAWFTARIPLALAICCLLFFAFCLFLLLAISFASLTSNKPT